MKRIRMDLSRDTAIEIKIDNLSYGGKGVGRVEGFVVFVPHTVPGDLVRVKLLKKKQKYAEAEIEEIIEASPLRIDPLCKFFSICGGCASQNIAYENQIIFKEQIVKSTLEHLAGLSELKVRPILASPEIWNYRNRTDLTFSRNEHTEVVLGFHKPGSYHEIIDVPACNIQPEEFNTIANIVRRFAQERNLSPYDPKTHRGLLRHLVMRKAEATGELAVVLLTGESSFSDVEGLADEVMAASPYVKGFAWGVNAGVADVARMDDVLFRKGDLRITEKIGAMTYTISPFSFFQTNSRAAEKLFNYALEAADLSGNETLFDAYCGTGAIGIYLAPMAKKVFGIDINTEAIWDARQNATLNGCDNCTFLAGPLKERLNLLKDVSYESIHRVVLDPPRGGTDKKSLRSIIEIGAPVVVYISCNPSILARDITSFLEGGYQIEYLQPLDMFPHTYHIETVVKLIKAK